MLTCEWCAAEFERPNERGTVPKFCSPAHRQRAYEVRREHAAYAKGWKDAMHQEHPPERGLGATGETEGE